MAIFSKFYKARTIKAITGNELKLFALGTSATGANPGPPTTATLSANPGSTTLGKLAEGIIPFAYLPVSDGADGAQITNSDASHQLTITAGKVVHYVALATTGASPVLYAYVKLTSPDTQYYYEEQGTLTIPLGNYKIKHA